MTSTGGPSLFWMIKITYRSESGLNISKYLSMSIDGRLARSPLSRFLARASSDALPP